MKLDYTFHSHTFRCGHAIGDIEDYVSLAIKHGYKIYGVSDHVFLPGVNEPRVRGDYSLLDEYISEFYRVQKKYEKDIKMYLGFECEYSDHFIDYYKSLLKDKGFDYLICGQHNGFDDSGNLYFYLLSNHEEELEAMKQYKIDLIKAMESGVFLYIAHPDFFYSVATSDGSYFQQMCKEIIEAAIKYDAVFEINIHGLYRNHVRHGVSYINYPCEYFWKEVAKTNIKVVLGGDYHNPNEIEDNTALNQINKMIKKYNIKISDIKEVYKDYRKRIEYLCGIK